MVYDTNIFRGRALHLENNYAGQGVSPGHTVWTDDPVALRSNKRICVDTQLEFQKEVQFREAVTFYQTISASNLREVPDPAAGSLGDVLRWVSSTSYAWGPNTRRVPDPAGEPDGHVLTRKIASAPDGYSWELPVAGAVIPIPINGDDGKFVQVLDHVTDTLQWVELRGVANSAPSYFDYPYRMGPAGVTDEFGTVPFLPIPTAGDATFVLRSLTANSASWQLLSIANMADILTNPTTNLFLKATSATTFEWTTIALTGPDISAGTAWTNEGQYHAIAYTAISTTDEDWKSPLPLPTGSSQHGHILRNSWNGSALQSTFYWQVVLATSYPASSDNVIVSTGSGFNQYAWAANRVLPDYSSAPDRARLEIISGAAYWLRRWLLPGAYGTVYQQYSTPIIIYPEPWLSFSSQIDAPQFSEAHHQLTATTAADGVTLKTWEWVKVIPPVTTTSSVLTATSVGSDHTTYEWGFIVGPTVTNQNSNQVLISRNSEALPASWTMQQRFAASAMFRFITCNTTDFASGDTWYTLRYNADFILDVGTGFSGYYLSQFGLGFTMLTLVADQNDNRTVVMGPNAPGSDIPSTQNQPWRVTVSGLFRRVSGTGKTGYAIRGVPMTATGVKGTPLMSHIFRHQATSGTKDIGFSYEFEWIWQNVPGGEKYLSFEVMCDGSIDATVENLLVHFEALPTLTPGLFV